MQIAPAIDPETVLPEVEKMLYSLAWKFVQRHPWITYEDAMREAYFGFVRACYRYKEGQGAKFSTWCAYVVNMRLLSLVTHRGQPVEMVELDEELCGAVPTAHTPALDLFEELSQDAQELVALLVETPAELLGSKPTTPKQLYRRVRRFLVEELGRDPVEVEKAEAEIRTKFNLAWACPGRQ